MQTAAAAFKPCEAIVHKLAWILAAIAVSALTLVLARQLLLALPADHFCHTGERTASPARLWLVRLGGVGLILLGAVMAIPGVPGQGLLLILLGLVALDVPILRRLELRLLRVPAVSKAVNRLRISGGKPPLAFPPVDGDGAPPP